MVVAVRALRTPFADAQTAAPRPAPVHAAMPPTAADVAPPPATAAPRPRRAGAPADGLGTTLARAVHDRALLQRKFWERTEHDTYVWHPEDPDGHYVRALHVTGEGKVYSRWRDVFSYPLYERAPVPKQPEPDPKPEPKPKPKQTSTKKKKKKKTSKEGSQTPVEDESFKWVWINGKRTLVATPLPSSKQSSGGGTWKTLESASAIKEKKALAVDTDAVAAQIDAFEGEPGDIRELFNSLFNALVAQDKAERGDIEDAYRAKSDRPHGFSVAVSLPPLDNWVLHVHCKANTGAIAGGENATHYKRRNEEGALGVSITLLAKQIAVLLPDDTARLDWARARKPNLGL